MMTISGWPCAGLLNLAHLHAFLADVIHVSLWHESFGRYGPGARAFLRAFARRVTEQLKCPRRARRPASRTARSFHPFSSTECILECFGVDTKVSRLCLRVGGVYFGTNTPPTL